MEHKKAYLRRLLLIMIAFFAVLIGGFLLDIVPNFTQGLSEGARVGHQIVDAYEQEEPRSQYLLWNVPIRCSAPIAIETSDAKRQVVGQLSTLSLSVQEPVQPGESMTRIAFAAIGNSPLIYALMIGSAFCFPVIILLMYFIIRSVRCAIREERPLAKNNVWLLRAIALLTILSELLNQTGLWLINTKAAEVLTGTAYTVDMTFHLNYSTLIMGILLLFAAEVFIIGRDLGEEQKLTI